MSAPEVRRVVTGHDREGRAVIVGDEVRRGPSRFLTLLWTTDTSPADNLDSTDGGDRQVGLTLEGGTVFRIARLAPGHRSPMHRTTSIDYGVVLEGELVLELDGGDSVRLSAGDVVIQRGTNHLWFNDSDQPCLVAFILIDAEPVTIDGRVLEPIPI
jgi:quercetin dioxygenase-like cupin family protein